MSVIGTLAVNVVSRVQGFEAGMKKARRGVRSFERDLGRATRTLTLMKRAAQGVAAFWVSSQFASMFKNTAEQLDAMVKTADKLGIASEKMAGLQFGASQAGVEMNVLSRAIQSMTQRVSEAAQGTGEAKDALAELRLDAAKLAQLSPDKMLGQIADKLVGVTNSSDKLRIAIDLFGTRGSGMINLLQDGSKGLAAFQKEAEKLGITFSREELAQVEAFNDALDRLSKLLGGIKSEIVIKVAPDAERTVNALIEASQGTRMVEGFGTVPNWVRDLATGKSAAQKPAYWLYDKFFQITADPSMRVGGMNLRDMTAAQRAARNPFDPNDPKLKSIFDQHDFQASNREAASQEAERARIHSQRRLLELPGEKIREFATTVKGAAEIWKKAATVVGGKAIDQLLAPEPAGEKFIRDIERQARLQQGKFNWDTDRPTGNVAIERGTREAYIAARDNRAEKILLQQLKAQTDTVITLQSIDRKMSFEEELGLN